MKVKAYCHVCGAVHDAILPEEAILKIPKKIYKNASYPVYACVDAEGKTTHSVEEIQKAYGEFLKIQMQELKEGIKENLSEESKPFEKELFIKTAFLVLETFNRQDLIYEHMFNTLKTLSDTGLSVPEYLATLENKIAEKLPSA